MATTAPKFKDIVTIVTMYLQNSYQLIHLKLLGRKSRVLIFEDLTFLTLSTTEFFTFLKAFESMSNFVSLGNSNFMALTALASYE